MHTSMSTHLLQTPQPEEATNILRGNEPINKCPPLPPPHPHLTQARHGSCFQNVLGVVGFVFGAHDVPNGAQRGLSDSPRPVGQQLHQPPAHVGPHHRRNVSARAIAQVRQGPARVAQDFGVRGLQQGREHRQHSVNVHHLQKIRM